MDLRAKIIVISGPTASGKSNLSSKLAKKSKGEIINADSMQVYKELKILSARPESNNYQNIKHHLYGFHNVKKIFSTGDWLKLAVKKIEEYFDTKNKVDQKKYEWKELSNKFKELKSLIYDYRDKKEEEIKELNENHLSFRNEIETNHRKFEKLIDEAADEISNFVEKAKLENTTQ